MHESERQAACVKRRVVSLFIGDSVGAIATSSAPLNLQAGQGNHVPPCSGSLGALFPLSALERKGSNQLGSGSFWIIMRGELVMSKELALLTVRYTMQHRGGVPSQDDTHERCTTCLSQTFGFSLVHLGFVSKQTSKRRSQKSSNQLNPFRNPTEKLHY